MSEMVKHSFTATCTPFIHEIHRVPVRLHLILTHGQVWVSSMSTLLAAWEQAECAGLVP
jgi:hypothetical protein